LNVVLYKKSLLLVEFDLCPSNQYILVRVITSCFHFVKMCLCQASLLSRCSLKYLTSSSWGSCTLFIWTRGHVSLRVVNVMRIYLNPLAFILHFLNKFWIAVSVKQWFDQCPWLLLQYRGQFCVLGFNLYEEVSAMQIGF
jgi:hypothetical protein